MKALGGSATLAVLALALAAPVYAFDPPQRLQQSQEQEQEEEDWREDEVAPEEPSDVDALPETESAPEADEAAAPSADEDDAVDLCAVAAEREATIDGHRGRVSAIGQVQQTGGGWEVEGVIETGRGTLGLFRDETLFTCFARDGKVENIRIDNGS